MEICKNCKWYEAWSYKTLTGNTYNTHVDNNGKCMHPNTSVSVTDKSDNNNSVMIRIEVLEYYYCPKYEKKA